MATNKKLVIFIATLLLFLVPIGSFAQSNSQTVFINSQAIKDTIPSSGAAEFLLSIVNNKDEPDQVYLSTNILEWGVELNPSPRLIDMGPRETKKISVFIIPPRDLNKTGEYGIRFNLRSEFENKSFPLTLFVNINQIVAQEKLFYTFDINPKKITPPQEGQVEIYLKNNGIVPINKIHITSASPLTQQFVFDIPLLDVNEEKKFTQAFNIDLNTRPGLYEFKFTLNSQSGIKIEDFQTITIEKIENVQKDYKKTSRLLGIIKRHTYTYKNTGNIEVGQVERIRVSKLKAFFISVSPDGELKEGEVIFRVKLDEGKTVSVYYEENYISAVIIALVILILVIFAINLSRKKLKITKSARKLHDNSIKITLSITNLKNIFLKDITLRDLVPIQFKIIENSFGTITPNEKKKGVLRQLLIWNISLNPKEELLLSYQIRPQINILGEVILSQSKAIIGRGRSEEVYFSNTATMGFSKSDHHQSTVMLTKQPPKQPTYKI